MRWTCAELLEVIGNGQTHSTNDVEEEEESFVQSLNRGTVTGCEYK